MRKLLLGLFVITTFSFLKGDMPAYQLFNKAGEQTPFKQLVQKAAKADVVLFGEQHNNAVAHWLQLSLTKALHEKLGDSLVVGAEMFERDDQLTINEYLNGLIKTKHFERRAKLWDNYETDYKPVLEFAKSNELNFIATNIPRRYANFVAYHSVEALDTFSREALQYMPPLPIPMNMDLPGYKRIRKMQMHGGDAKYLAQAQAVKDAAMAKAIVDNRGADQTFLHLNGNYHSNNFEGIYWYLNEYAEDLEVLTISTVSQEAVKKLNEDHEGKADFIICTQADMTKTY